MALMEELRAKEEFSLLNEGNLERVLVGLGYSVRYISSSYKLYTYWKEKGVDVAIEFNALLGEGKREDEIIAELEQRLFSVGLPEGKFNQSLRSYLWFVLASLGKVMENQRPESVKLLREMSEGGSLQEPTPLILDLNGLHQQGQISERELEVAKLLSEGYTWKDVAEQLDIGHEELGNIRESLTEVLSIYFGRSRRAETVEMAL